MTFTFGFRRACATLALSAAIGTAGGGAASAQDLPPPPGSFSLGLVGAYALVGGSLVDFAGGGLERAFVIGGGLIMGALGPGSGPFSQASYGVEVDSVNMTGTGSGWGIDRVRGAIHGGSASVRYSALAGLARTRSPFGSETGYSVGLRVHVYPQGMQQLQGSTGDEVIAPGNIEETLHGIPAMTHEDGKPPISPVYDSNPLYQGYKSNQSMPMPSGPSLFIQADYNDTGTYRTRDVSIGFMIRF